MGSLPEIWVDRGGTFTDCVLRDSTGELRAIKVRSSDEAPLIGIRELLDLGADAPIPPCDVRVGTTVATNALLEGAYTPTALIVDEGFGDLLAIDDQTRPHLFEPLVARPPSIVHTVIEDPARIGPNGEELRPVDGPAIRKSVERAIEDRGIGAVAIAKLHASRFPAHERALAEALADLDVLVVTSHDASRTTGLLGRAHTAVADAALTPALRSYIEFLRANLPGSRLRFLKSDGGLVDAAEFRGRDALMSGPAGGVVAVAATARAAGEPLLLGLDMGGTSTDVCRWSGEHERRRESRVGAVRVRAPMLAVHTVAAGGGSLLRLHTGLEHSRATVGPASAGAIPGPLCYGHPDATEPALTDAALVLGRVRGDRFPLALDVERAREGLAALAEAAGSTLEPFADGLVTLASATMADALAEVTVARGHDPSEYALAAFGGAAGQYACRVARQLGVRRILSHPFAGVLSAWGMGAAPQTWHGEEDLGGVPLDDSALERARATLRRLGNQGEERLAGEAEELERHEMIRLRYAGTQLGLEVPADAADPAARFAEEHERHFGYTRERSLEVVGVHVEVSAAPPSPPFERARVEPGEPERGRLYLADGWAEVDVWRRESLPTDEPIEGPLLVLEETGALVVEREFVLTRRSEDDLLVVEDRREERDAAGEGVDLFRVEILAQAFAAIAERMGVVLRRSALSTNIRDRLDYSCAIFDGEGALVANAPHIPVHLGAMSASVRAILAAHDELPPGSAYVTNDPAAGGSHLPDLTVVAPVHDEGGTLQFLVAARGHHADVGGITPGSMPARSSTLMEEGVVFRGVQAVRDGQLDEPLLREILEGGPFPARRPDENLADLEAQLAACRRGAQELLALGRKHGFDTVSDDMKAVIGDAEAAVREAIGELPEGAFRWTETLDDGTAVEVAVEVRGGELHVDFTGTAPAAESNLNAPRAVTEACVLYAVRTLVGRPIPLNDGCMRPIRLTIPEGCLLDPPADAAVAAGNVETSQRVVDAILAALGRMAPSQGTMNNVTFGDGSFGYYETLAGGVGAAEGWPGPSATHVHMTNSRVTDPEILERRYPIRVRRFAIRRGSGGVGAWDGGDGLVRELEALAPLSVAVLSERRAAGARGLEGGDAGVPGLNEVLRTSGSVEVLGGRAELTLEVGDVLRIATPGGGGYGRHTPR